MIDGPSVSGRSRGVPEDGCATSERPGSPRVGELGAGAGAGSQSRKSWAFAAAILALGSVGLVALIWETAASTVQTWANSSLYSHGFLIIPVCGFLLWRRRNALARLAPRPNYWGIAVIVLMALAWRVGEAAATLIVQQLAMVGMIQALFLTVVGARVIRVMTFPLFYLYFAVPFGSFLIAPLQIFTAEFIVGILQSVGVPVQLDGLLIHIPKASFLVAEACAGARFLLATLAVGVLAANLFYRSWTRRLLFVGLSIAVPIIANGLRASGIVLIAHLSNLELAVGFDHVTYGLVFLSFVMLSLLALGVTFRERDRESLPAAPAAASTATTQSAPSFLTLSVAGAAALIVMVGMLTYGSERERQNAVGELSELSPPPVQAPWMALRETREGWRPVFPGADVDLMQTYAAEGRRVDLYLAFYNRQRPGGEVVNELNGFADGKTWTRVGGGRTTAVVEGAPMSISYTRIVSRSAGLMVWHWYWVDGRFTSNPYIAKLLQAKVRLWGGVEAAAVVAIAARYDDKPAEASEVIQAFLEHVDPIRESLARAASRHSGSRLIRLPGTG